MPISLPAWEANLAGDVTSRFILHGDRAYGVTSLAVGAVDLSTGETLWQTRFPDAPEEADLNVFYGARGPGKPLLSTDGATVYAALTVRIEGTGTRKDAIVTQLVALDAETGELVWSVDIPSGPDVNNVDESARVVDETDGRIVLVRDGRVSGIVQGIVTTVDATTRKVLWSTPGDSPTVTSAAVIVSAETARPSQANYPQLTGLDPGSGAVKWRYGDSNESAISGFRTAQLDNRLIATLDPYSGKDDFTIQIDPATGEIVERFPTVLANPVRDGDALYDAGNRLSALNPETLQPVWSLPTEERKAPTQPVFFGGLIYGGVGNATSVVLDGKTGEDVTTEIPGTFVAVNEYGALMLQDRDLVFVRATG